MKQTIKRSLRRVGLLVFSCLILFPVASSLGQDRTDPLQLGSILILSGEGASWGVAAKNGIDLAVAKINQNGGVLGRKLEVSHQDDRGDPKQSISAFRLLTGQKKVDFIIGTTWSNLGLPLVKMADSQKVIMISPTLGVAEFNESSRFLFNTWPHDYILSQQLAEYVFSKGHRQIALISAEQVWVQEQSQAFRDRFQSLGGKIILSFEAVPGTKDLKTEALRIKASDVDAVVSTTDGIIIGSLVAKALLELKAKFPLYSITLDQAAIDASQGGFEGLEFLTSLTPTQEFKESYEARYATNIDIGAASAYDAVMMLAKAIEKAGTTDTEIVAKELSSIKKYQGVSGNLVSDGRGGFTKPYALKKVVKGVARDLKEEASYRLAGIFDLSSGSGAQWGNSEKNGFLLAVKDFLAANPGTEVDYKIEDSAYKNETAVTAFRKLTAIDNYRVILGPTWEPFIAVQPLCEAKKVFCVSLSCNNGYFEDPKLRYSFTTWIDERDYTRVLAREINSGKFKKLALIAVISPYHDVVVDSFLKAVKLKPAVSHRLLPSDTDFKTLITRLPDDLDSLLLLFSGERQMSTFLRQWKQLKAGRLQIFTDDYILYAADLEAIKGFGFEIFYSTPDFEGPKWEEFSRKHNDAYGEKPGSPAAAVAYDTVSLVLACMKEGASSDKDLANCFRKVTDYRGFSGIIDFSGGHFAKRSVMKLKSLE